MIFVSFLTSCKISFSLKHTIIAINVLLYLILLRGFVAKFNWPWRPQLWQQTPICHVYKSASMLRGGRILIHTIARIYIPNLYKQPNIPLNNRTTMVLASRTFGCPFGHPNPEKAPLMRPKNFCEEFLKMSISSA